MNMGDRIKMLRKSKGLTQEEFSKKIAVNRGSLAKYETGKSTPIDAVVFSICREFKVNEDWLRYGIGEKDAPVTNDDIVELAKEMRLDDRGRAILSGFAKLDENGKTLVLGYITRLLEEISSLKSNDPDNQGDLADDLVKVAALNERMGSIHSAVRVVEKMGYVENPNTG